MPGTTKQDLLDFLDYVSDKGLMKQGTARALKTACSKVFGNLDENEERDVIALDLDEVCRRFENLNSTSVAPNTMQTYRKRVKQAVSDFERFNAEPSSWKPSGVQRAVSSGKRMGSTIPKNQSGASDGEPVNRVSGAVKSADEILYQFPLRQDVIVTISGIPFDVKKSEMGRMTAFLSNLVADVEEAHPPMLTSGVSRHDAN